MPRNQVHGVHGAPAALHALLASLLLSCQQVAGDPGETWEALEWIEADNENITFWIERTPERLPFSVRIDGTTLLDEELTPTYTKVYPYGRDCGGCVSATETVTLPAADP